MRGLYAILDVMRLTAQPIDPLAFARAVLLARPCALQVRAKELPAREMLALLRALRPMCRKVGVPLVANDRADLAALAGADMVHVGQDDLPVDLVRRLAPGMGIGVSTHTPEQLTRALKAGVAYVGYGPVFPTSSKAQPDPVVGLEGLRVAAQLVAATRTPLVAIGGITLEVAREVGAFADAVAVISGLLPSTDAGADLAEVTARVRAFDAALAGPNALAEAEVAV